MSELLSGNAHSPEFVIYKFAPIQIKGYGSQIFIAFPDGNFVEIGRSPHQILEETLTQIEDVITNCQSKHQSQLKIMRELYDIIPSVYTIITFKEA